MKINHQKYPVILFRALVSSFSDFANVITVYIDKAFECIFDFIEGSDHTIDGTLNFVGLDDFFSSFLRSTTDPDEKLVHDMNHINRTVPSATSFTPVKTPDEILFHTALASVSIFSPILGSLESAFKMVHRLPYRVLR